MPSASPFFSVVIPVHNRAHLIGECLTSVLGQTDQDFEIIVVDNNSTDDLAAALLDFTDPRIHLIHCSTPGPSAARNAGVREARGEYVSLLDSDDLWSSDVLQECRKLVIEGAQVVYLVSTSFQDGQTPIWNLPSARFGSILRLSDVGEAIAKDIFGTGLMAAVKKKWLLDIHGFDESLRVGEDFDWAMHALKIGPAVILADKTRLAVRLHGDNICKNIDAYVDGTRKLLNNSLSGIYATDGHFAVRRQTVRLLVASTTNIAIWGRPRTALSLYLKIIPLGLRWHQLNHVLIPQLLRSWFTKRLVIILKKIS